MTPRQIAKRMTEQAIRGRRDALRNSIAKLLPEADQAGQEAVFSVLASIPPQLLYLREREADLYTAAVGAKRAKPRPVDWNDAIAALGDLKPGYKRNPRRLMTRLQQSRRPLEELTRGRGRPSYSYRDLIVFDVDLIEHITENSFTFTRDPINGKISGKKFDVLMAALDCQLFTTGKPRPETVTSIAKILHE